MNDFVFDPEAVAAKVREIAAAEPDFKYHKKYGNDCKYVVDGQGACIIGRALVDLGCPPDFFCQQLPPGFYGETSPTLYNNANIHNLAGTAFPRMAFQSDSFSGAVRWLSSVQDSQDSGATWGEAVAHADRYSK